MAKKLGLMFGSYSPPHEGHIHTAETAKIEYALDCVYILPIPKSPLKQSKLQANFNDKLNMCRIIANPYPDWLRVSDKAENFSTSYIGGLRDIKNIVCDFQEENPDSEIFIVSGKDFKRKLMMALAALEVSKYIADVTSKKMSQFDMQYIEQISLRLNYALEVFKNTNITDIARSKLNNSEISSSIIRKKLHDNQEYISGMPEVLIDYIYSNDVSMD